MALLYLAPRWFFGFDIALELLFGAITGLVALFSFKIYHWCEQKECKLLGIAFSTISLSYFVLAFLNLMAISKLDTGINAMTLHNASLLTMLGAFAHVTLFITGLSLLVYFTFGIVNQKLFVLITSLSLVVLVFSFTSLRLWIAFNFVAALLLFYICLHYFERYKKTHDRRTLLMLTAFGLLFLARVGFTFSTLNPVPYVVDHAMELIAYTIIAVSLIKRKRA